MLIQCHLESNPARTAIRWKDPETGIEHPVSWEVCGNPICNCTIVTLSIQDESGQRASLQINVLTGEARLHAEKAAATGNFGLKPEKLTEADYAIARDLFRSEKANQVESCDASRIPIPGFSAESLDAEGLMIPYREIFPHAHDYWVDIEKEAYIVLESYCPEPSCSCSDAIFHVYHADGIPEPSRIRAIFYNFGKDTYQFRDGPEFPHSDKMIFDALRAAFPGFASLIRKRSEQVKTLYKRFQQKSRRSLDSAGSKPPPGRNDPCNCGSGKKYKKCCGA